MSKYTEYVKKQEEIVAQLEKSATGIDNVLYKQLLTFDRTSLTSMTFSEELDKYVENGREYNLYREEGFAYKHTVVFLYEFLEKNGFTLPQGVSEKYKKCKTESQIYSKLMESTGTFEFSTIRYILSIDLGLREQMKQLFGEQIINEAIFPKFETVKTELATIETIIKDTKRKHRLSTLSTDNVKAVYIASIQDKLQKLENMLNEMKTKILSEGIFTLDNHPQYKQLSEKHAELSQKISRIQAMTDPQEIEQLRTEMYGRLVDYQSQYTELREGRDKKGLKDKSELEHTKTEILSEMDFATRKDLIQKMEMLLNSTEFAELRRLIEEYETQSQVVATKQSEKEALEQQKDTIEQMKKTENDNFVKMGTIKQLLGLRKSGKYISELSGEIRKIASELEAKEAEEKQEQERLDILHQKISQKIGEISKVYPIFNQYFSQPDPEVVPEWRVTIAKFDECTTILGDSKKEIEDKISELEAIQSALNYVAFEEQHPGVYETLEIGVSVAEEEIASRKK